jgi:hypothetical protein
LGEPFVYCQISGTRIATDKRVHLMSVLLNIIKLGIAVTWRKRL